MYSVSLRGFGLSVGITRRRRNSHDGKHEPLQADLHYTRCHLNTTSQTLFISFSGRSVRLERVRGSQTTDQNSATLYDAPMNKVNHLCFSVGNATDMFKKPAAEDVLPKSKNHGLNPSDDPLWMIL